MATPSPSPAPSSRFDAELAAAGSTSTSTRTTTASSDRASSLGLDDSLAGLTVLFGRKDIQDPYNGPMFGGNRTNLNVRRAGQDDYDVPGRYSGGGLPAPEDSPWSLSDALLFFYDMTPKSREIVQAALYNKGLLPKKWDKFGDDDEVSFAAWKKTLLRASRSGKSIWQVLSGKDVTMTQFLNPEEEGGAQINAAIKALVGASGGGGGRTRAPLQVELTNPEDLKQYARNAAVNTLGYTPQDDFLDEFVQLYQGMEGGAQRKAYAGAGKVTRPGNPEVVAQKELRTDYDTEAAGFGVVKAFQDMLSIMGVEG